MREDQMYEKLCELEQLETHFWAVKKRGNLQFDEWIRSLCSQRPAALSMRCACKVEQIYYQRYAARAKQMYPNDPERSRCVRARQYILLQTRLWMKAKHRSAIRRTFSAVDFSIPSPESQVRFFSKRFSLCRSLWNAAKLRLAIPALLVMLVFLGGLHFGLHMHIYMAGGISLFLAIVLYTLVSWKMLPIVLQESAYKLWDNLDASHVRLEQALAYEAAATEKNLQTSKIQSA